MPQWTGGQPTGVHHISSRGRGWWVAAWGSVVMALRYQTCLSCFPVMLLSSIAGELYVLSIRGVPLAGSLIQIVDPSKYII